MPRVYPCDKVLRRTVTVGRAVPDVMPKPRPELRPSSSRGALDPESRVTMSASTSSMAPSNPTSTSSPSSFNSGELRVVSGEQLFSRSSLD